MEDLLEACNEALYNFTGTMQGVKRRQLYDDIRFMESEQGWSVPLERVKDGRSVYYRYADSDFSIRKQAINESEANQIRETLSILNRFKGMPQFEWMEELLVRIDSAFQLDRKTDQSIVGFEQNPYLRGLEFITALFNAIQFKRSLDVVYQGFKQEAPQSLRLHPYYLKQYNNRWFLFAYNEQLDAISNLALDRILSIEENNTPYIENNAIDFEEYFYDVVGVTVTEGVEPEKVLLYAANDLLPYIESKPLHGSQRVMERQSDGAVIELTVQLNYELISLLFSFGERITVIAPEELRSIIKTKAEALLENYS